MRIKELCSTWPPPAFNWANPSSGFDPADVKVIESNLRELDGAQYIGLVLRTKSGFPCVATFSFRHENANLLPIANSRICAHLGASLAELGALDL